MTAPRSLDSIYRTRKRKAPPTPVRSVVVPRTKKKSKAALHALLGTFALTGAYIILAPFLPGLAYTIHGEELSTPSITTLHNVPAVGRDDKGAAKYQYYGKNVLTIPKMGVDSEILEGVNEDTLERGLWRRPQTSTPELGGNTVIAAHRFKYTTGANTFYHLDKLKEGDSISLTWKGKTYNYIVSSSRVTSSTDPTVEAATKEPILTLYTCTPLWTSKNRLVVVAKPVSAN